MKIQFCCINQLDLQKSSVWSDALLIKQKLLHRLLHFQAEIFIHFKIGIPRCLMSWMSALICIIWGKKKITFKMKNNGLQKYNIYSVVKKDCQLWWCQLDMCCTLAVWTQISFCSINHYIRRFYLQCQSLVKMCIFINFLK